MNAEQLHDAISLLPEDLLEPVDRLRQKKQIPWRSVTALAACACLIVGLWFFFPGDQKAADNCGAVKEPVDSYSGLLDSVEESMTETYLLATVLEVAQDHITVLPDGQLTGSTQPLTVKLDKLENTPSLENGQQIKLYFEKLPENDQPLIPYRIEIVKD